MKYISMAPPAKYQLLDRHVSDQTELKCRDICGTDAVHGLFIVRTMEAFVAQAHQDREN